MDAVNKPSNPPVANPKHHKDVFHFSVPETLIAKFPAQQRQDARLLVDWPERAQTAGVSLHHSGIKQFCDFLSPGDVVVVNDTTVRKARIQGRKHSGGSFEILIERPIDELRFLARIRMSGAKHLDRPIELDIDGKVYHLVLHKQLAEWYEASFDVPHAQISQVAGTVPIPPYLNRDATDLDTDRYQTVYHGHEGHSCAAPTAGLHFDLPMLDRLEQMGVEVVKVRLDVGSGTFAPIRHDDIHDHVMHSEFIEVSVEAVRAINQCKERGNKVIAVGTTVVRSLESAKDEHGQLQAFSGESSLYITPGYQGFIADALLTNFHQPGSSLVVMLCAYAGIDRLLDCYQQAIKAKYRWLSYGDAMLISCKQGEL